MSPMNLVIVGAGPSARLLVKFLRASKGGKSSGDLNITVIQPNRYSSMPFYQTLILTKRDTLAANSTFSEIEGVDKTVYGVAVGCCDGAVAVRPLDSAGSINKEADVVEVKFDILVAATGFSCPVLTSQPGQSRVDREKEIAAVSDALTSGKNVVIAGGGVTGVELAGDVLESLPEASRKGKVTLVCSSDRLLPDQDPIRGEQCQKVLASMGCNFVFNDRISSHDKSTVAAEGQDQVQVQLKSGKTLKCQAYIAAYSQGPNSSWILQPIGAKGLPNKLVNDRGEVKVNEYLQSTMYGKLYAAGAVNSRPEPTLTVNLENHAKTIAANILRPESVKVTSGTVIDHAMGQVIGHDSYAMFMPENTPLPAALATLCCDWCGFPCNLLCPCFLCGVVCGPLDIMTCGWCCGGPPAGAGFARTGANMKKMNMVGKATGYVDLGEPPSEQTMKR